ncbi:hypothetical protein FH972_008376 [Carpinus fangiana]|uniref:DNA/RNA-binding protein Alba-like domain-containing protein n=1 Tax=Carpinus fangiana TaxID=176857 RepID=A0A5N6QYI4_9ROSI|nr:hypothetical protein FH972_008376 [Carpinus fangiana]
METSKTTEGGNNSEKLLVDGAEGEAPTANVTSCSTETSKTTEGGNNDENLVVGPEGEATTPNATSCSVETSKNTEGGNKNENLVVDDDVGAEGEATTPNATSCLVETSKNTEGGNKNENLVVDDDVGAEGEAPTANSTSCSTETSKTTEKLVVVVDDVGAEGEATTAIATSTESQTKKKKNKKMKNHIQVSNTKKPLVFYLNLAKRFIKQYNDVKLSGLGMAIPTVVTISETLKRNGLAIEQKIAISSVGSKEEVKGRIVQKAQIEIVLTKAEKLDKITVATSPKECC